MAYLLSSQESVVSSHAQTRDAVKKLSPRMRGNRVGYAPCGVPSVVTRRRRIKTGKGTLVGRSMKKDDEGGLILTEKYSLSQASGICAISESEALVCGKSTTESLRSLLFSSGKSLTEKYSF